MTGIVQGLLAAYSAVSGAVSDAYFNLVTLLLPGNGTNGAQNNTFLDSSTNNFTITRNGNTTQGTFSPFSQTGWSNYASATSGSVGFSNSTAALVSSTTSTFTAECWIYMTEAPVSGDGVPALIGMDATFNSSIFLGFGPNASRNLVLRWFDGASKTATGGTALALNTWYHIAVVANSNALAMYVNGVAETLSGTTTLTNRNSTTNTFSLFLNSSSSNYQFRGYASNIRVCTSAVYTGAFTPSTSPLTTTSQGATNCKLLTAQDNRFIDNSTNAYTLTVQGSPSIQPFSPFLPTAAYSSATVGGSGYFDGTGDYLSNSSLSPSLSLGTSDFCIEAWGYWTSFNEGAYGAPLLSFGGGSGTQLMIRANKTSASSTSVNYYFVNSGTFIPSAGFASGVSGGTIYLNSWNHIAVTRQGSTFRLFVNGALVNTQTDATSYGTAYTNVNIGADTDPNGGRLAGYMTGARVVTGSAVYTAAFTPPTAPLTAISGTYLLANFTNAGITDATAKNDLETVSTAQISTARSKFGGSSIVFNGTSDTLTFPSTPNLALGTGDFTIEFWVNINALPGSQFAAIYDMRTPNTDNIGFDIMLYFNKFSFGTATNVYIAGTTTPSTNTWYHYAVTRSGNTFKQFLNGTQEGTTYTGSSTQNFTNNTLKIANGANGYFNGYLSGIRVTKGYARYTANFTPPTAAFPLQ
jgi:hypothetical protein